MKQSYNYIHLRVLNTILELFFSGVYIGATIISLFLLIASIILVAVLGLIFAWTCKNQPESSMAENEMVSYV